MSLLLYQNISIISLFLIPGIKGDLVVQLMPEPLPALSTSSQDQELDITVEEVTPDTENIQADAEEEDERTQTCVHGK